MTDSAAPALTRLRLPTLMRRDDPVPDNRYAEAAIARHKRKGMELAVRARIAAMAVTAVFVTYIAPWPQVLYYHALIVVFVLIGLAHQRVARVGKSRAELALLFADLVLMAVICIVPNPFEDRGWPLAFQYQFDTFLYFFVLLGLGTLAYSWRTLIAMGTWTFAIWMTGALAVVWVGDGEGRWTDALTTVFGGEDVLVYFLDPANPQVNQRLQEALIFLIVAVTLAVSVRRFNRLVLDQAGVERERANLARYFSPNVVDELSHNDEPLKTVRSHDVAVLFVDIVGFTRFASERSPEQVIETLRAFHARMEACVFDHHGTLDKYLGDGLMATFGTPLPGRDDALNALRAACAMAGVVDRWNETRVAVGEPEIRASFGVHYGPVVVGDVGANRLEYAVIGNTVNVAARLEALTRALDVRIIASDDAVTASWAHGRDILLDQFEPAAPQPIRGIDREMAIWTMA